MKKVLRYLRPYAGTAVLAVALLFARALGELTMPRLMSDIVDNGIQNGGGLSYIYSVGGRMLLLALGMGLAGIATGFLSARISAGVARDLRLAVFTRIQGFSKAEIDKFSTASLITRSTNDVKQVEQLVLMGINFMAFAPVMGVGSIIMAVRTSPGLSWIIALAIGVLLVILLACLSLVLPKFRKLQTLIDKLNLVARESLTGLLVVRAFGNEKHEEARFAKSADDLRRTERFVFRAMDTLMPSFGFLVQVTSILIVWFGGRAIQNSQMQVGDMMAYVQYAMHVVFSFFFVAMAFVMIPRAQVSAKRIAEILETPVTVKDADAPQDLPAEPLTVAFEHVSFRYGGAEEDVLHDISCVAKPGETLAFIGATGAGKTTLMHLLERFYDVTGGRITLGGVDIRDLRQADLRRAIGFVPQKAVLFSGSIESNVRFGAEDDLPTEAVHAAIDTAQARDFVAQTEAGLDAPIAQEGANVSGGQKQRLAIARALARKPRVYVFDDSFSALDFKTDAALRRALAKNTKNAAVLIVTQRVSTVLHAEKIVVLDEGGVVGMGTHKELLQNCAVYREIAESQISREDLAS
jgi:ATP-binding cassette subfamily B protein